MERSTRIHFWFLIAFLALIDTRVKAACAPSLSAICPCELFFTGPSLTCTNVGNLSSVVDQLSALRVNIYKLAVQGVSDTEIGDNAFGKLNVRSIELSNTPYVKTISPNAFTGQSGILEELKLSNLGLIKLPIFASLPKLVNLDISDNHFMTDITEGAFANAPNIKQMRAENTKICSLSPNSLIELRDSLELLDMSGNCLSSVPAANLRGQNKLMYLDLSQNAITDLPNMQFMNLPLLTEVRLHNNQIRTFRPMTFMNVPHLQHLNLANNSIGVLDANRFQAFDKLETLDLSGNQLTKLPATAFGGVAKLKQLNLDNNKISSIETLAFSDLPTLELLSLQNNGLTTLYRNAFDSLPKLAVLQLNHNMLTQLNGGMFEGVHGLQQLHMRDNRVTTIEPGTFDAVNSLTTLDMANNKMTQLDKGTLNNLHKLFWLDLSGNQLATIDDGVLPPKVATMLLNGNPLVCDEKLEPLVKYLVTKNVRTFLPDQQDVVCAAPPKYAGTRLKELMIKKAGETFNNTFNALAPNAANVRPSDLGAITQLLPNLLQVPGVGNAANNLVGGQVLSTLGRSFAGSGLPGSQFMPGAAFGTQATDASQAAAAAAASAEVDPARALNDFTKPLSRLVGGYQLAPNDVTDLVNSLPKLVEANAVSQFDISQSPDLLKHILRGGQIPGVPKQVLDNIIATQMKNIAKAAAMANEGISNEFTNKTLPPLNALPTEFIQQVAAGQTLPGLTANETLAVKDYYLKLLAAQAPSTPNPNIITGSPDGQLGPGIIAGVSAADLMKRLPPNFDLSRLPPALLASVAAGQPFDLTQMPPDMLAAFRDFNPDLKQQIDEALARPKLKNVPTVPPPMVKRPVIPWNDLKSPYDISAVDRQTDLKLKNDAEQKKIMIWTGVGLAIIAVVSAVLLAYMCYRRKRSLKAAASDSSIDRKRFINGGTLAQKHGGSGNKLDANNINAGGNNNNAMDAQYQQPRGGVPAFGPILPTTYANGQHYAASNMVSPMATYVVPTRKISPLSRLPAGAIMDPIEEVMSPPMSATTNKQLMNNNTSVVSVAPEYEQFRHELQNNVVKSNNPTVQVTSASSSSASHSQLKATQSTPISSSVVPTTTTHMSGIVYGSPFMVQNKLINGVKR